ncbi:MAG: hypothetical protein UY69_C0007G0010 [Parcubacteria group bacterium GW2011_GWF1_52_5]|nr:MAG: hypothetical protein UY66_C0014G0012 [Parcubacteria group bacterium GW2011_GWC1_51_35]KKW27713.1 MAG: hypothetical protein UY69_C0007G0010 [Parcubacteria group bacterium GW2011_GWF1_52_5]KKW34451.1 MAG: hypothetical protein UY80_C0020G0011 [Parcubacteria group bacterium GW2011_GWB1_53_43]
MEVRLAAASLTSITCACTLHLAHGKRTSGSAAAAERWLDFVLQVCYNGKRYLEKALIRDGEGVKNQVEGADDENHQSWSNPRSCWVVSH